MFMHSADSADSSIMRASKRSTAGYNSNKMREVVPKNTRQQQYVDLMNRKLPTVVVAKGPAGCGKSLFATHIGVRRLLAGSVSRIVITRPAVCVDEHHGFLPGSLDDKMEPWARPILDILSGYFSADDVRTMLRDRVIEMCPLAFMRGRTFENSWIICDEAQNCSANQMLMVLTRIGLGSKLVITGDPTQHDRGFDNNGLADLVTRLKASHELKAAEEPGLVGLVEFEEADVERHPVIQHVLRLYGDLPTPTAVRY